MNYLSGLSCIVAVLYLPTAPIMAESRPVSSDTAGPTQSEEAETKQRIEDEECS